MLQERASLLGGGMRDAIPLISPGVLLAGLLLAGLLLAGLLLAGLLTSASGGERQLGALPHGIRWSDGGPLNTGALLA